MAPTMSSRQHFHEQLWACFDAQRWEDKELVIIETYETSPSAFLQQKAREDDRLVHVCIQRSTGMDFSVGLKRNMALHMASGQYVANFDDDDIYAANYLSTMVGEMQAKGLAALTLSGWYNFIAPRNVVTYSDPTSWDEDDEDLDNILYGFGFSYVHERAVSLDYPYPDVVFAEDAPFFLKLREVLGYDKVALLEDTKGICIHIVHRANSTGVDCFADARDIGGRELRNLSAMDLPVFQQLVGTTRTSLRSCVPICGNKRYPHEPSKRCP
jgi:hypothetical protein